MKETISCPFCQQEIDGKPFVYGMSPYNLNLLQVEHSKNHK